MSQEIDPKVEKSLVMAGRIRGIIMDRYSEEPLPEVFTALLLVASEIAHSQGIGNVEFRRIARDVYRSAEVEFMARTAPKPKAKSAIILPPGHKS